MDDSPRRFGRYEVLRTLGSGGMGEILLARQRGVAGVDRLIVLKTVLPHLAREPGFIERFVDEMRVSMLLTHGNIVQVYDVGEADGRYYMAMEWVDGLDLREVLIRLERAGRLMPEEIALYILMESAKGLAYAHTRRDPSGRPLALVHRDVSPANILISNDGQVKITDFGVAVATARLSFSVPGTLHGKVAYMSPEQVTGSDLDARSDQFSLGVVGYEMLCGERPFDGDGDLAILEQVRRCEPRPLGEIAPWLDPALARIVMRALARDPEARFPTMEDFARAIADYMFATRKVVSARTVSEFMASLQETGAPKGQSEQGLSLDDVAREMVPLTATGGEDRVTVETRVGEGDRVPSGTKRPSPKTTEGRFGARHVLGAIALFAGVAGGMWWLGRLTAEWPTPVEEEEEPGEQDVAAERTDAAVALDDGGFDDGTEPVVILPTIQPEALPEPPIRRTVLVRSQPEGAEVYSGTRRIGTTPVAVMLTGSRGMRLDLRLAGYEQAMAFVGPDSPATVVVPLKKVSMGRVRFRFFPADAQVFLDDDPVQARGNIVDRAVVAGAHVLTVRAREEGGPTRVFRFEVRPDQVVELGTIELPAGPR